MVDVVEYCDRPVRKKDGGMLNPNNIPWTHHNESDDSDEEDVVPLGEFWHIPEDEWTVVVRPQKKTRGNQGGSRVSPTPPVKKLTNSGGILMSWKKSRTWRCLSIFDRRCHGFQGCYRKL